jgi:hypothetical protein
MEDHEHEGGDTEDRAHHEQREDDLRELREHGYSC